jgi:hypothetical protein
MRLLKAIPIFILIAGTAVYAGGRQDAAAAEHVLNRLGYGARPGDVERVLAMGIDRYIESQLNPRAIPDAGVTSRLAAFHTLDLDSREITERFFTPPAARAEREEMRTPQEEMRGARRRGAPHVPRRRAATPLLELSQQ